MDVVQLVGFMNSEIKPTGKELVEIKYNISDSEISDLRNMKEEYSKSDSEHQKALLSMIKYRTEKYSINDLPSDLQLFIRDTK